MLQKSEYSVKSWRNSRQTLCLTSSGRLGNLQPYHRYHGIVGLVIWWGVQSRKLSIPSRRKFLSSGLVLIYKTSEIPSSVQLEWLPNSIPLSRIAPLLLQPFYKIKKHVLGLINETINRVYLPYTRTCTGKKVMNLLGALCD